MPFSHPHIVTAAEFDVCAALEFHTSLASTFGSVYASLRSFFFARAPSDTINLNKAAAGRKHDYWLRAQNQGAQLVNRIEKRLDW
jgi:hypothetical protein